MSTDVTLTPQHVIVALPPPHTRADVHALRYSAWASAVARDEPKHDTVPSASRSTASLVQALARGEPYSSSRPGYDLTLERLTFVEYREGHELAGLLIADVESSLVLIHRVLVAPDYRSSGAKKPTPSVMRALGHRLITHAIKMRGSLAGDPVGSTLADFPCVMAHLAKWTHIFRTLPSEVHYDGMTWEPGTAARTTVALWKCRPVALARPTTCDIACDPAKA